MFVLAKECTFTWPVSVLVPGSGRHEAKTFQGRFRVVPARRAAELMGPERAPLPLLREALIGWQGVVDEQGQAVPYSEAARDALLDHPFVLAAVARAYADALSGGAAAEKN